MTKNVCYKLHIMRKMIGGNLLDITIIEVKSGKGSTAV